MQIRWVTRICLFAIFYFILAINANSDDINIVPLAGVPFTGVETATKGEGVLPRRLALIIGINEYESISDATGAELHSGISMPHLNNAENDAILIDKILHIQANFTTILLTSKAADKEKNEATRFVRRIDILNALDKLKVDAETTASLTGRPPVVLVYFSGHGIHHDHRDYFVPSDFKPKFEEDISDMAIPVEEVQKRLSWAGATLQIIISDACRVDLVDNGALPVATRSTAKGSVAPGFEAVPSSPPPSGFDDRLVVYSTLVGSVASDGKAGPKEGPVAATLADQFRTSLDEISKPDASGNKTGSATDIEHIIKNVDGALSKQSSVIQRMEMRSTDANFLLFPTEDDYQQELKLWNDLQEQLKQARIEANADFSDREFKKYLNEKQYCLYNSFALRNLTSPYSYFGRAALMGQKEAADWLKDKNFDLPTCSKPTTPPAAINNSLIAPAAGRLWKLQVPRPPDHSGSLGKTQTFVSLPGPRRLEDHRTGIGSAEPQRLFQYVADTTVAPPQSSPPSAMTIFEALAIPTLRREVARQELQHFEGDGTVTINMLVRATIPSILYADSNLTPPGLARIKMDDLVQVLGIGGTEAGRESLKVITEDRLTGFVRQTQVDYALIGISFVVDVREGADGILDFDYNHNTVDSLLSSSVVVDGSLEYEKSVGNSAFKRSLALQRYLSKYWINPRSNRVKFVPFVSATSSDNAEEAQRSRNEDNNTTSVKVVLSLLPLSHEVRQFFPAVSGHRNPLDSAVDVSAIPSFATITDPGAAIQWYQKSLSDECRDAFEQAVAVPEKLRMALFLQNGSLQYKNSELIRFFFKQAGYAVPSAEEVRVLPSKDQVRICLNQNQERASSIINILNRCQFGSFELQTIDGACSSFDGSDAAEIWLGSNRDLIK